MAQPGVDDLSHWLKRLSILFVIDGGSGWDLAFCRVVQREISGRMNWMQARMEGIFYTNIHKNSMHKKKIFYSTDGLTGEMG